MGDCSKGTVKGKQRHIEGAVKEQPRAANGCVSKEKRRESKWRGADTKSYAPLRNDNRKKSNGTECGE